MIIDFFCAIGFMLVFRCLTVWTSSHQRYNGPAPRGPKPIPSPPPPPPPVKRHS